MKKVDFKFEKLQIAGGEKEARMVPVAVGDEFNFTLSEKLTNPRKETIQGVTREWTDVVTDDADIAISAAQITRRNNGLPLTGKTIEERLKSFTTLFSDEGTLKLKVSKIVERKFIQEDGTDSISRYLKFNII